MTDTDDDLKQRLRYRAPNSACGTEMRELLVEAADRIDELEAENKRYEEIRQRDDAVIRRLQAELRAPGVAYPGFKGEPR